MNFSLFKDAWLVMRTASRHCLWLEMGWQLQHALGTKMSVSGCECKLTCLQNWQHSDHEVIWPYSISIHFSVTCWGL